MIRIIFNLFCYLCPNYDLYLDFHFHSLYLGDGDGSKKPRSSSKERRSGPHHRGSRESLTDSVQYDEEQPGGIKTKIFHALGLNS